MDRDRLLSILGMLASDNAGERASAALKASQLVQSAGKSWDDLIAPATYDERLDLAFQLTERGWNTKAAAGIASVLNVPMNGECPNLAGWRDGRWSQLLDFCGRSNNADHTSLKSQLDYLTYNLNGVYSGLSSKIRAAKTTAEAKALFSKYMGDADGVLT